MEAEDRPKSAHGLTCRRPAPSLDCEAARAVVEAYFAAAQERFEDYERRNLGASTLSRVQLMCAPWRELHEQEGFTERNFAATSEDGLLVVAAPELAQLPPDTVEAIMAHELGHALDFLHPARYVLVRDELLLYPNPVDDDREVDRARLNRMRQWINRDSDVVEATADEIAAVVMGREIRYAGPCYLQSFETGTRRPAGLR